MSLCAGLACAAHHKVPKLHGETEGSIDDKDPVAATYRTGLGQSERGLYQEAIRTFDELKLKHPYSRFAALSELRASDAYVKRQEYLTAIEGYRSFLRFHPSHPDAAYALEQIGEAFFAQIPKDFWLLPPAAEKDLETTRQAIETYEDLLSRFSGTHNLKGARAHLDACRRKLGDHELMVARFYHRRGRWPGALGRAKLLLNTYANLGFDAEAKYLAGSSLVFLGQTEEGRRMLVDLAHSEPHSLWARSAQRLLAKHKLLSNDGAAS